MILICRLCECNLTFIAFFLWLGGRIDHAHHYNNAYRALDETLAMETAVLAALAMVNPTETLIVLTSDHSHVITLGGQATPRGHPILGKNYRFLFFCVSILYAII